MSGEERSLQKSFDIDDGELYGMSPQECFVLGYELAMIDSLLEHERDSFTRMVHATNRDRIQKWCDDADRECRIVWHHGDSSETWMQLDVAPLPPLPPESEGAE